MERTVQISCFQRFKISITKLSTNMHPLKDCQIGIKAKQLYKPWITTGIKVSIAVKSKLYASGDDSRYKYYRNKICSLIRLS